MRMIFLTWSFADGKPAGFGVSPERKSGSVRAPS